MQRSNTDTIIDVDADDDAAGSLGPRSNTEAAFVTTSNPRMNTGEVDRAAGAPSEGGCPPPPPLA